MRIFNLPYTIPGQWITGFTILGLVIAPTACNTTTIPSLPGTTASPLGFLLNNDPDKGVLGGLRIVSRDSVWVYGSLNDDGTIREVTGLALRDAAGQEASLTFELGRPKHAKGFDGSTLDIDYQEVSTERLKGSVEIFLAASGERQTIAFDIDLKLAAAELARRVEELTGLKISGDELPSGPPRVRVADASMLPLGKQSNSASFAPALAALYVFAYATAGFLVVSLMTQMMGPVLELAATFITLGVRSALVILFSPFIIMGNLLRGALFEPIVILDFDIFAPTIIVPSAPR